MIYIGFDATICSSVPCAVTSREGYENEVWVATTRRSSLLKTLFSLERVNGLAVGGSTFGVNSTLGFCTFVLRTKSREEGSA